MGDVAGFPIDGSVMKEIEDLYRKLLQYAGKEPPKMDGQVRSRIFRRIMEDLERLQEKQGGCESWTDEYWKLDREIRLRLLKEIQIIIDDYTLAQETGQLDRWEKMYGNIDHYKEGFYRLRMDKAYEQKKDLSRGFKFVKGKWEKVEFMKLP
jgi:hypothetical protein